MQPPPLSSLFVRRAKRSGIEMPVTLKASKYCCTCGRSFTWRASYGSDWPSVKYCSRSCRSNKPHSNPIDRGIEVTFLQMLLERSSSSSKCSKREEDRWLTCEEVQDKDGEERRLIEWRERYRRAGRRIANVRGLAEIEHEEKAGKWLLGDGKGRMRLLLRDGKFEEAEETLASLQEKQQPRGGGEAAGAVAGTAGGSCGASSSPDSGAGE